MMFWVDITSFGSARMVVGLLQGVKPVLPESHQQKAGRHDDATG